MEHQCNTVYCQFPTVHSDMLDTVRGYARRCFFCLDPSGSQCVQLFTQAGGTAPAEQSVQPDSLTSEHSDEPGTSGAHLCCSALTSLLKWQLLGRSQHIMYALASYIPLPSSKPDATSPAGCLNRVLSQYCRQMPCSLTLASCTPPAGPGVGSSPDGDKDGGSTKSAAVAARDEEPQASPEPEPEAESPHSREVLLRISTPHLETFRIR